MSEEPAVDLQYPALLHSSCTELQMKPAEVYLPCTTTEEALLQLYKTFVNTEKFSFDLDFLVDGKLLRETLQDHYSAFDISTEQPVKVELIKKTSAPERKPDVNADDWVTSISESRNSLYFGCADGSVSFLSAVNEPKTLFKTKFAVQSIQVANSMLAVGSRSSTIELLKIETAMGESEAKAQMKWQFKGHTGPVSQVSFEQTAERLASVGQDGMLKIWSTVEQTDNENTDELPVPAKQSKLSSVEPENKVKLRAPLVTLAAHQEPATVCLWCRDSYTHEIVTGGFDNCLKVYDLNSLKPRASYTRDRPYNTVDRSRKNSLVATACFDTKIRIYDVRAENEVMVVQAADAHDELVSCLKWSADLENLFISGSYDSLLKMWDFRSPKVPLFDIKTSSGKVLDCLWIDSDIYFGGEDCKLYCFSNKID